MNTKLPTAKGAEIAGNMECRRFPKLSDAIFSVIGFDTVRWIDTTLGTVFSWMTLRY